MNPKKPMLNVLTIDVEDYFQVHAFSKIIRYKDWDKYECRIERNVFHMLEILNDSTQHSTLSTQNSPKGTFFVLGWIAERYPQLIGEIHRHGHEIACHGYAHKLIYKQTKEEFREDIRKTKIILEDITGSEVIGYRAPSFSITSKSQWAFEVLIEEGFKYDSSIFPIRHDFYGFPTAPRFPFLITSNGNFNFGFSRSNFEFNTAASLHSRPAASNHSKTTTPIVSNKTNTSHLMPNVPKTLIELPISTVRLLGQNLPISGGGYFRFFPYPFIRKGLKSINEKEGKPFIFYLHPWEIDPDQPRIDGIPFRSKFRHYVNINKTEGRFKRLLEDFQFSSVRDLLEQNRNIAALNNSSTQVSEFL